MHPPSLSKLFEWGIIALLILLLVFVLQCTSDINPLAAGTAFALLIAYYILSGWNEKDFYASTTTSALHISICLILSTFVVWTTTSPHEESAFWVIFLLPILATATRMELGATLTVTAAATLAYFLLIPLEHFPGKDVVEDIPEFVTPAIVFFLVAILVQFLSREMRQQIMVQKELNTSLVENQKTLQDSLTLLADARQQLRRQEHLAALGEMAAGVAHEIRNPLGIVASSAQLLEEKVAADDQEAEELLLVIREETHRLNELLNDFLAFGREIVPQFQTCDVGDFVHRCMDRFAHIFGEKEIIPRIRCVPEKHRVSMDPDLMEQALLNLILNAVDATPLKGEILVTCSSEKDDVIIDILDSGEGIPEAIRDKIFTPFFTTKSRGSGLGLSNAFQCIRAHNGTLDIVDHPGPGTLVRIYLPGNVR